MSIPIDPRISFSELQNLRKATVNLLPNTFQNPQSIEVSDSIHASSSAKEDAEVRKAFPHTYGRPGVTLKSGSSVGNATPLRVGVVLSGGQASGGHNVIVGVFDFIKRISPESRLFGFLDGPQGIYKGQYSELTAEVIDGFRNSGGFDMIGSGRHKIEKPEEFAASLKVCQSLELSGLVVIGGDDSNTNAAHLAEYFEAHGASTRVIG